MILNPCDLYIVCDTKITKTGKTKSPSFLICNLIKYVRYNFTVSCIEIKRIQTKIRILAMAMAMAESELLGF